MMSLRKVQKPTVCASTVGYYCTVMQQVLCFPNGGSGNGTEQNVYEMKPRVYVRRMATAISFPPVVGVS